MILLPIRTDLVVYLIYDSAENLVKIGQTRNLESRLINLRKQYGSHLIVWAYAMGHDRLEKLLHLYFEKLRVKGEWFVNAQQILLWFHAYAECRSTELIQYGLYTPASVHAQEVINHYEHKLTIPSFVSKTYSLPQYRELIRNSKIEENNLTKLLLYIQQNSENYYGEKDLFSIDLLTLSAAQNQPVVEVTALLSKLQEGKHIKQETATLLRMDKSLLCT